MAILGIPTSKQDVANAGWIRGAATGGARLLANGNELLGDTGSPARLRAFADNVDNPDVNFRGVPNPPRQDTRYDSNQDNNQVTENPANPTATIGTGGGSSAADLAYLDTQESLLRGLLSSSQNALNQGLTNLSDSSITAK